VALAASHRRCLDELSVDIAGRVTTTRWRPVELPPAPPARPGPQTVVITGGLGGLGIRAAAVLARLHNMHPLLIDRKTPDKLGRRSRRYLRWLADGPTGVTVRTADITVPGQVSAALSAARGPVSAVLHCAGVLHGGRVDRYRPEDLVVAQAVKVAGLRHVLAATDRSRLRNLVVFGSILAEQEPHNLGCYALANELLRRVALRLAAGMPDTATVVAQWSIWSGAGMAHDVGVVGQARRMGLVPIALRPGMSALRGLLAGPPVPGRAAALKLLGTDTGRTDTGRADTGRADTGRADTGVDRNRQEAPVTAHA